MQMIYQMRYSFFGKSGWRSETSNDKAQLLDPERLKKRHYFLEKIALRSLQDQTDGDFALQVLSSDYMDEANKRLLVETCKDMLGERAHVFFRKEGSAGDYVNGYRKEHLADEPLCAQIVLDDDDAVALDFTERLRAEAEAAWQLKRPEEDNCFISHSRGISAKFSDGTVQLSHRNVQATNLGLALVAPAKTHRSIFGIAHKKIVERRPTRIIHSWYPAYIRAVHDTNDSRGFHTAENILVGEPLDRAFAAFPLLADLLQEWKLVEPAP